jgi:hypothetical protein
VVTARIRAPRAAGAAAPADGPPWSVLILVLDSCRADKIGACGFARPTMPTFDALARDPDAVLFQRHYTQAVGAATFAGVKSYHPIPEYGFARGFDPYFSPASYAVTDPNLVKLAIALPLVVKFPKGRRPASLGPVVRAPTRTIDLTASLIRLAGGEPPGAATGVDILAGELPELVISEQERDHWAAAKDGFRLVHRGDRQQLFRITDDLPEARDLAAESLDRARQPRAGHASHSILRGPRGPVARCEGGTRAGRPS